jgi:hypothetical protein
MSRLRRMGRLVLAILRELAHENAYRRHLAAHGRQHSGEEWRRFCDHHLQRTYARPRCC